MTSAVPARKAFIQVAINTAVAVGGVCLLFRQPLVCAAVFVLLLIHTTRLWRSRSDFFVAGAGLVGGAVLEIVATRSGLWRYAYPSFAGIPLWIFALWPAFMIGLPRFADTLSKGGGAMLAPSHRAVGIGLTLLIAEIVLLAAFGNTNPLAITLAASVLCIAGVAAAPSRSAFLVLMIGAGFGIACESWPVQLGIWSYPAFGPSGMPPWLAPGYAVFGLAVVHLGQGFAGLRRWRQHLR